MKNNTNHIKLNRKKMKSSGVPEGFSTTKTGLKKKRRCLKCGKQFLSKGPYNRICDKCGLMNERVASSTYSVSDKSSSEPNSLEKRFYGLNL
jgi:rRNA maturation endonuclease Nob1